MVFGLPGLCCFQGGVRWCLSQEHAEPLKIPAGPSVFSVVSGQGGWTERTCVFFPRLHEKSPEDHQKILQVNDNLVWGTDLYIFVWSYDHMHLDHFWSKYRIAYICICNCTHRYIYIYIYMNLVHGSETWVPNGMRYIQPEAPKGNCF